MQQFDMMQRPGVDDRRPALLHHEFFRWIAIKAEKQPAALNAQQAPDTRLDAMRPHNRDLGTVAAVNCGEVL